MWGDRGCAKCEETEARLSVSVKDEGYIEEGDGHVECVVRSHIKCESHVESEGMEAILNVE